MDSQLSVGETKLGQSNKRNATHHQEDNTGRVTQTANDSRFLSASVAPQRPLKTKICMPIYVVQYAFITFLLLSTPKATTTQNTRRLSQNMRNTGRAIFHDGTYVRKHTQHTTHDDQQLPARNNTQQPYIQTTPQSEANPSIPATRKPIQEKTTTPTTE
jgi:hypothetical protein